MYQKVAITIALLALIACSKDNGPETINSVTASPDCVFPDSPGDSAPGWVCDEPVEGIAISAVGIAEPTKAGISYQKQQAETDGRVRLAQNINTRVHNLIKQYVESTGTGDNETVDRVNSSVTRQLTNQELIGSRLYTTRTSSNGTLYALMGMDQESVSGLVTESLNNSMTNDSALWQKVQADKSHEELTEEILKQQ